MGGTNMQRGSSSTMRTVMIFSLGSLVVVTVLYLAKRVEVNNTIEELELTRLESRDMTEQLNNKISTYEADVESLTQNKAILSSRLSTCESQKTQCEKDINTVKEEKNRAAAMLSQVAEARDSAVREKAALDDELAEIRTENMQLADDLDSCEAEKEELHIQNDESVQCSVQLADAESELNTALQESATLSQQLQALTAEKHNLLSQIETLKAAKSSLPAFVKSGFRQRPPIMKSNNNEDYNTGNEFEDDPEAQEGQQSQASELLQELKDIGAGEAEQVRYDSI